jgi:hypothetical protein
MQALQAKQLSLPELLSRLGYQPTKVSGSKLWYRSPLHAERTASFCVAPGQRAAWVFADYGANLKGTIIDFAKHYNQCSVKESLIWLEQILGNGDKSAVRSDLYSNIETESLQIKYCQPIKHPALIVYLKQRAIAAELARRYCWEVHYKNAGKARFALGWKTDSGGWCLRAPNFKACVRPAGITTIGTHCDRLAVFEGMFDFLAALSHYCRAAPRSQVIILNSVAHLHRVAEMINGANYQTVRLYLDNDQAGRQATQQLLSLKNTVDASSVFYPAKDFAQWYEAGCKGISLLSPAKS